MAARTDGIDLLKRAAEQADAAEARLDREDGERLFPESFRASGTPVPAPSIDTLRER
jgi:hypothetical protein